MIYVRHPAGSAMVQYKCVAHTHRLYGIVISCMIYDMNLIIDVNHLMGVSELWLSGPSDK